MVDALVDLALVLNGNLVLAAVTSQLVDCRVIQAVDDAIAVAVLQKSEVRNKFCYFSDGKIKKIIKRDQKVLLSKST